VCDHHKYQFETAYDDGGLPEAVAAHALWDATLFLFAPFLEAKGLRPPQNSGVPHETTVTVPLISGAF